MKTKKIYQLLVYLFITTLISSCNFLDVVPDNVATEDNVFADRYTVEKYLATCYSWLPRSANSDMNPGLFGSLEMVTNIEFTVNNGMKHGLGQDGSSTALMNYWNGNRSLYAGIRECNTFMDGIDQVKDLESSEKARMKDEVKTLKAYMHFSLLRYYGPICPLRTSPSVNESTQGVRVYRENIDDCFQYIIDLLDEVIDNNALPLVTNNPTTELGRFTLPAVHMLKAKVLVYWASPLFNGNTDYNSFLNHKGEPFFNQTYCADRWTIAAEACKTAIEVCEEAGIRLYKTDDYIAPKKMSEQTLLVQTLRGVISHRWNPELVWSNTSDPITNGIQAGALTYFESPSHMQDVNQKLSVPLHTVELFYTKNGVPIDEDKEFDYSNRYKLRVGDAEHRYYIAEGETTAALNFDREPRYYSTLGFDRGKWYGNSYKNMPTDDSECMYPKNRSGECSSIGNPGQYNLTGYWPKKLVSINSAFRDASNVTWESYPFPDMRFADLLLMYAEALNETKNIPDQEVYHYIDMVRERAGLKGVVESWAQYSNLPEKPLSKEGMREIIHRERQVELACEGVSYWDSHRWKTAPKEQNRLVQGWNIKGAEIEDYYTVTTVFTQSFAYNNYFAPIPESDIIKNPQLIQNPGW